MFRLFVSFTLLIFIAIVSIGGCDGGGSGGEPTPGSGDCDFIPDESGQFYTEDECEDLADAFGCGDFSFEGDICEVFSCEDCLCGTTSNVLDDVPNLGVCKFHAAENQCFSAFFEEPDLCTQLVCVQGAVCGPFHQQ